MPLLEIPKAAGDARWVRARYRPEDYAVPPHELRRLRGYASDRGSEDLLAEPGGPFEGMREVHRFDRDGKRWVRLVGAREWAVDVELTKDAPPEILTVDPEAAWQIAREWDARQDPPTPVEPVERE